MCRQGQSGSAKQSRKTDKKACNQVGAESDEEEASVDMLETWSLYRCALQEAPELQKIGEEEVAMGSTKGHGAKRFDPMVATVAMNGHEVAMELDTRAVVTVMSLSA